MEAAAINILKRAVELDESHRYTEAKVCYEEGIQLLLDLLKSMEDDGDKKRHYRTKIKTYIDRAEVVKNHIEEGKKQGNYHEQIVIEHNSIGHSYQAVFGRFLNPDVTTILLEDPYIRNFHQSFFQCQNLLRFSELVVKSCPSLKVLTVVTSQDPSSSDQQVQWLEQLQNELWTKHKVNLTVTFSVTLHDRQIKLSNGWIIKMGRGLDYFKPPDSKFSLGFYDLDLRPCHATTVNIFHEVNVRTTYS